MTELELAELLQKMSSGMLEVAVELKGIAEGLATTMKEVIILKDRVDELAKQH